MLHLIKTSICTVLIVTAMIFASNKAADSLYTNVYVIVSKGSLSMVKNSENKVKVFARNTDK